METVQDYGELDKSSTCNKSSQVQKMNQLSYENDTINSNVRAIKCLNWVTICTIIGHMTQLSKKNDPINL